MGFLLAHGVVRAVAHDAGMANEEIAAELRERIETADVLPDELSTLIGNTFGHGRIEPGSSEVEWSHSEGEVALRLVYTKTGKFKAVTEPALTDDDAKTLIDLIHILEQGGDPTVWRTVLFSSLPVNGFFRYDERWQIRPVPPEAPRPAFVMAPHPFILEVKGNALSDPIVGWMRGGRLLWEAQLVLALLLEGGITGGATSAHHEWIIDMTDIEAAPSQSVLGQVTYLLPAWPEPLNDLSDVVEYAPLTEVSSAAYFARPGISHDSILEIPDILIPLLRTLDAVTPAIRERFFRAAYWFGRSTPSWRISRSLSYISLINAIEVLTSVATVDRCPSCGLNRAPGPTARFREIVERHAGSVPERKELYALRSRLVHGDQILVADRPTGWGFNFTPQSAEERHRHELASQIARIVLIGWLFDVASDD